MEDKRFAILIDGDNTSSKYIKTIIEEVTKEGAITYKRIYGDWTKPSLNNDWKDVLLEYSITPIQQYAYTKGKNSTDSAMIIDAMDILYTGKVDGFCLASSDSDFTRLAARLREAGMIVLGMGKQQTPKPFVTSCSKFKYVDLISNEPTKQTEKKASIPELQANEKAIKRAVDDMIDANADAEGWLLASTVGTLLQNQFSDFDCRNYGYKKTIDLLKHMGYKTKVSHDGTTYYISKPADKKSTKKK